jgi:dihydrofolate reductase
MRKIIVTEFITLDGVIEAPGGNETAHPHGGWSSAFRSPESGKYKMDELASADALLLGKTTYEGFAAYWPGQTCEGFADPIKLTGCRNMSYPEACRRLSGTTAISCVTWVKMSRR